jgi:hypothetical protein
VEALGVSFRPDQSGVSNDPVLSAAMMVVDDDDELQDESLIMDAQIERCQQKLDLIP